MFRIREILGWLLIMSGLSLIWVAFEYAEDRKAVEASVHVFAAMFVFRGGIQLVKVATAARICLAVEQQNESNGYSD